jgi:hypothetical protein
MMICDLCRRVTDRLHSGPKGAEKTEVCDACDNDLKARLTVAQREEAAMREARWVAMIEHWKTERAALAGTTLN